MVRLFAAALVLVLGAVAAAQEVDAPEERVVPLAELTARAQAKAEDLWARGLDPGADREALRRADVSRLTLFVGTLRVEGEHTLSALLGAPVARLLAGVDPSIDASGLTALLADAGLDAREVWTAEGIAPEWFQLAQALDELRSLDAALGPVRVCPVLGESWFLDTWGEDRPGDRSHKGVDMMGRRGIPVQAIEAGVVVQANWHRQGGRQIYVRADATGDVYYYAHLDTWEKWIWTGTRVEAGDVMGRLGSSGNADSPHLHFGWMPGSRRVDLDNLQDPYPLLVEICPDNEVPEWFLAQSGR